MKNLNILLINRNFNKLKNRNLIITPFYVGKIVFLYNGKTFEKLTINKKMVGYKIGEFFKTRKTFKFRKN